MVLDKKYTASRLKIKIEAFTKRRLLGKITANSLTLIAAGLGILAMILLLIPLLCNLQMGFYRAQEIFWADIKALGLRDAWENRMGFGNIGQINWGWGDLLVGLGIAATFVSFGLDVFDGALARLTQPTKLGGILDIFFDRLVELCLIIAILAYDIDQLKWAGIVAISAIVLCISIFLLIGGAMDDALLAKLGEKKKVIYYSGGLMERTETFLFIVLMLIFPIWRLLLLWIFASLVIFTAFQRLFQAVRLFKDIEK